MAEARRVGGRLGTVPVALTSLIGRDHEIADLSALIPRTRLLSLTGPGGGGKTRLAMAVGESVRKPFRGQVAWVDLGPPTDAAAVPGAIASTLGIREVPGTPLVDSMADRLRSRSALLVLDSCEHVAEACAELVERLLLDCPRLRVLVTSRRPLGLPGEVVRPVPPLEIPDADRVLPIAELAGCSAVALFVERATAAGGFRLTDQTAGPVAQVCRQLEGNPLALELAAARVSVLGVEALAARLDDLLGMLVGADRSAPDRHRTLRATLDWSYQLLPHTERELLVALSVFAGSADLDAVQAVHDPGADPAETLGRLAALVDQSLVVVEHRDPHHRYRLLDAVRRYAAERLPDTRNPQALRARHATFYLRLAEHAEPALGGPDQRRWLDRLVAERDNLHAAVGWSIDGWPEGGLRLAAALWRFGSLRGRYTECRDWLEAALRAAPNAPVEVYARALVGAGVLAHLECDYDLATERLDAALDRYRALGDRAGVAGTVQALGSIARERGDLRGARERHEESLAIWREIGDEEGIARSLHLLGFASWLAGDFAAAATVAAEALENYRRLGDHAGVASALISLGAVARYRGDLAEATALLEESLATFHGAGNREGVAWAQNQLGGVARLGGDPGAALSLLRDSLRGQRALGDRWRTASLLEELAAVLSPAGEPERAAWLLGAAAGLRGSIGTPIPPVEQPDHDATVTGVREALADDAFRAAFAAGRVAAPDRVTREAYRDLAVDVRPVVTERAPDDPGRLHVQALGSSRVVLDGQPLVPADFGYAKPRELLYFLVDHGDCTKEQIGLALWPWAAAAQLRNSFHTSLHHLRTALGGTGWITFRAGRYAFATSTISYDVASFEDALAAANEGSADRLSRLEAALATYTGDYLPDLPGEAWIDERRTALRSRYERALLACGRLLLQARRPGAAADVYRRAIEQDALVESAHRGLMRAYAAQGEPARALRQYRTLTDLLQAELGVPPAAETAALYEQLRSTSR